MFSSPLDCCFLFCFFHARATSLSTSRFVLDTYRSYDSWCCIFCFFSLINLKSSYVPCSWLHSSSWSPFIFIFFTPSFRTPLTNITMRCRSKYKQSNFLSNKKKPSFDCFFPFYIKMQVLPDQFMHSVWPQGRLGSGAVVGSVWVVLRKEKLLCSPTRAASLSEECCTFYFCPHKTDSLGEKKGALSWMPRRDLTVTLRSTAAGVTPSPSPSPSSETLTLDRMRRGGQTTRRTHEDKFKDRRPGRASGPPASVHKHTMGTHVTWMFDKLTTVKLWPKINLAP